MKKSSTTNTTTKKKKEKWSTRKCVLVGGAAFLIVYSIVGTIYTICTGSYFDSTITSDLFDYFKWLAVTGCAITVGEIVRNDGE